MGYVKVESNLNIWLPTEENQQIEGEVKKVSEGKYGLQYDIDVDGEVLTTPSHKVLQNRLKEVVEGNKIKIVYLGEQSPKVRGESPMKMYDVYIDTE